METSGNIVKRGPNRMTLMLALFDQKPSGSNEKRMLEFHVEEIVGDKILSYRMKVVVNSVERLGEDEWKINGVETENEDLVTIKYSTKSRKGAFEVGSGLADSEHADDIGLKRYIANTCRKSSIPCDWCHESIEPDDGLYMMAPNGANACKTCYEIDQKGAMIESDEDEGDSSQCNWCRHFFRSEEGHQTYDGDHICETCYEQDEQGPQIARYGTAEYEAENEPTRVVDADGKVEYE